MPISFQCQCGKSYRVKDELAGRRATCKSCGQKMTVPNPQDDDLPVVEVVVGSPESPAPPTAPPLPLAPNVPPAPLPPAPIQQSPLPPPPTDEFGQPLPSVDPYGRPIAPPGASGANPASPFGNPRDKGGSSDQAGGVGQPPRDEIDSMVDLLGLNQPQPAMGDIPPSLLPPTPEEQAHFEEFNQGGAAASNPGKLKVSPLRYVSVFPKWFLIIHGSLLFCLLMSCTVLFTLFGFCFWPLALLGFAAVYLFWRNSMRKFYYGNVNPAMILSLDPPLVAVYANMTKIKDRDVNAVSILSQPLSKMTTGVAQVGQRVATVSFYEDRYEQMLHWSDVNPTVIDLVCGDPGEVQRVLGTISGEDWREMDHHLAQVAQPYEPGIYLTFGPEERPVMVTQPMMIDKLIRKHISPHADPELVMVGRIPKSKLKDAAPFLQGVNPKSVIALIRTTALSNADALGIAMTTDGVFFNTRDTGPGRFPWQDVRGAFAGSKFIEIVLVSGQRVYLKHVFPSNVPGSLDNLFNEVCGRYSLEGLV